MPDVFLFYSRRDADFVRRLGSSLQERVWDACTGCRSPEQLLRLARGRVTRELSALERRAFLGDEGH